MNEEIVRMNQRRNSTPENLLCPLHRQLESGKLLYVRTAMEVKLEEAKRKNPTADYVEAEQKIQLLIELEEYQRQLFEMAYQSRIAASRTEHRLMLLQMKYDEAVKENKELKQSITL
jgi:hypothetical protein